MSFSLRRGEKCHLSCVMLLEVGVLAGDRGGVNSRGEGLAEFTLVVHGIHTCMVGVASYSLQL